MVETMPASPKFVRSRFGLETNTQMIASPLTNSVQRLTLSGARWMLTATLPVMTRAQFAEWQAFLLKLNGSSKTFYGFDPDALVPRGNITGSTTLVNGASQTGSSLTIDGLAANTNGILLPGDYFTVGGELKMVTAPLNSNGSGEGTVYFQPAMRSSPADDAPLTLQGATCEMVLIDDAQTMWASGSRLGIYDEFTFSAMEVFA